MIVEGSNIIGIYLGERYGTSLARLVVIGAHWDTTGFTDGYKDNGSGVAAMIEVAKALTESCRSLSFMAFNTEEVGSHEFVRTFLVGRFFTGKRWPEFQGALIFNTIMNYNNTAGSQTFHSSWAHKITGTTYQDTVEDNFRETFISLISRSGPEKAMADMIERHWNNLARENLYLKTVNTDPIKFKLRRQEITRQITSTS